MDSPATDRFPWNNIAGWWISARTLVDPAEFLRGQTERMKAAAAELKFEMAAKIKAKASSRCLSWERGVPSLGPL